ncbi:hypothetical protein DLNHIDIE_03486 [Acidithiobacillus thiooxidans ATCC 19377]|uniref:Ancillary SecYEG translocon subunit/Cell division coordinator CpoB TPR domain-containing protein n=1 Tax=Acidithiobacillus thiooxidans ATCC 19377 TaxID=637390 RepID=A0A543PYP4_ACITH|nr:hypothetical protein DLNHIDIE_03486 [Acidithiobacillus thiooxidans ATCC 19377]
MTGPELTEFFHRHRTLLIIGVLFFLFVGLAVLGYNKYQQHQMQQAALLYSELVNATVHKNNSVARASAESIINTYNHTPYGTLAHFFLARLDMEDKQVAVAEKAFKAIIDHHEVPLGMHSLARLSLARLYVDHRKRSANPPLRIGANQANADFFQFHGKSSWSFLLGQVGSFSRTSQRYAKGSMPLSLHVSMML